MYVYLHHGHWGSILQAMLYVTHPHLVGSGRGLAGCGRGPLNGGCGTRGSISPIPKLGLHTPNWKWKGNKCKTDGRQNSIKLTSHYHLSLILNNCVMYLHKISSSLLRSNSKGASGCDLSSTTPSPSPPHSNSS